jgi:hypothetical protein
VRKGSSRGRHGRAKNGCVAVMAGRCCLKAAGLP